MNKKRTYKQLTKSMNLNDFNRLCKKVAEQYATSEERFSISYFSDMFNITKSAANNMIEYAIVNDLIEDYIVFKIRDKAVANQRLKCRGAGSSSEVKYARLYARRCKNIASLMPEKYVKEITLDFALNREVTKQTIATYYGISTKTLDFVLVRAIEKNIADDTTVDMIEARSIMNASTECGVTDAIHNYFNGLRKKREENKNGISL